MKRAFIGLVALATASCVAPSPDQAGNELSLPACAIPRPQVVASRSFLIFFDPGSVTLNDRSRAVLGEFARFAADYRVSHAMVGGNTDRAEARRGPADLSARRAEAARQFLIAQGMQEYRVSAKGYGATRLLVSTDAQEPQNRRVELVALEGGEGPKDRQARADRNECRLWMRDHCFPNGRQPGATAQTCRRVLDTTFESQ